MNMKLVIVGAVFVILMVLFGKNPIEEERAEREKKRKGLDDPLIEAITEYNKTNPSGRNTPSIDRKAGTSGSGQRYPNYMMPPNYSRKTQQPAVAPLPQQPSALPGENPNKTYYPPPPVQDDSVREPTMGTPGKPRSDAHLFLRSGQQLAFRGTKVYYQAGNGELKRLPDGRYQTGDGLELFVQDGRKTIESN